MESKLTIKQITDIAEAVVIASADDLYDPEVNYELTVTSMIEDELNRLEIEWSDDDVDKVLSEMEFQDLMEHRRDVFQINRTGILADLGLSQADFI